MAYSVSFADFRPDIRLLKHWPDVIAPAIGIDDDGVSALVLRSYSQKSGSHVIERFPGLSEIKISPKSWRRLSLFGHR
jgi:hypothetical protein